MSIGFEPDFFGDKNGATLTLALPLRDVPGKQFWVRLARPWKLQLAAGQGAIFLPASAAGSRGFSGAASAAAGAGTGGRYESES